jgi:hypothetical protein
MWRNPAYTPYHDAVASPEGVLDEAEQGLVELAHPRAAAHVVRAPPVRDGEAQVRVPRVALRVTRVRTRVCDWMAGRWVV